MQVPLNGRSDMAITGGESCLVPMFCVLNDVPETPTELWLRLIEHSPAPHVAQRHPRLTIAMVAAIRNWDA
jgi:hypothetical protein